MTFMKNVLETEKETSVYVWHNSGTALGSVHKILDT